MRITCHGSVTRRSICSKSVSRRAVRCRCGEGISGPKPFCSGSILTIVAVSSINATLMYASVRKMILHFCDPSYRKWAVSDVVLDDGSHMASHQLTSFQVLFPLLNEGGVYICEDLHAAYSPAFDGGYRRSGTFIEVAKQIVDDIHADFHDQPQSVPGAHRSIHGICFYNSMVVIEKRLSRTSTRRSRP